MLNHIKHTIKLRAIQAKGLITRFYRTKPDFIIVGAQKAGTTGLFWTLKQHSLVRGSAKKEVHFFNNDAWYSPQRLNEYHAYFPYPFQLPHGGKVCEASPDYLFDERVAARIHAYDPNVKIIVIVRDPAERAFSGWTMYHHHFKGSPSHDPNTFTEAIDLELEALRKGQRSGKPGAYVERGYYARQIENYLRYFPKERIHIIESSELKSDLDATMRSTLAFIGLPFEKLALQVVLERKVNEQQKYQADIARLRDHFQTENERLFALIGKRFDWNKG